MGDIEAIVETAIYMDDLDAAEAFYRDVHGLEVIGKGAGGHALLRVCDDVPLAFVPEVTLRGDPLQPQGPWGRATSTSGCGPRTSTSGGGGGSKPTESPSRRG